MFRWTSDLRKGVTQIPSDAIFSSLQSTMELSGMSLLERSDDGAVHQLRCGLVVGGDAEGFHLAVEVGAFEAEGFGGAGDVAVAAVEFFEDVVALVGFAGLQEGGELFARAVAVRAVERCLRCAGRAWAGAWLRCAGPWG